jgi:serine/threonine-protein kinase
MMLDDSARLAAALSDHYRIERLLGQGGMATVYLATDLKHDRDVAVKVLRPELAATVGPDRFTREIEIAAKLTHPHILPLHDSGEADGFLFYVMPYVEGETLRDRLHRVGPLPVGEAIRVTEQVATALHYAHERDIVHRDIKPENILLTGDQAVVADFGIARAVTAAAGSRLTETGLAVGTPHYMSPEQGLGSDAVDARSDVYALGCMVFEMVSGRPPFEGETAQAVVAKHVADSAPTLRAVDRTIPLFVERAVDKALAKAPADRFQTSAAFAEALVTGAVVARVGRAGMRGRRGVLAAAALGLVAAVLWIAMPSRATEIERLAVLPPTNLLGTPEQEPVVDGMHNALITELSQAGVAVVGGVRSMARYRASDQRVRDIAAELDVDALVEPSVFWTSDSVGIDVRLVDGRSEASVWSRSYTADARNVLALYREVTRAIAGEISRALVPEGAASLAEARAVDPAAHEAYLRGRFHAGKLTPADLATAEEYYETALALDSSYAAAHAGLAWVWVARRQMNQVAHEVAAPRARAAAERAIQLDSTLSEAQHALGVGVGWVEWDWELQERALRRALQLHPGNTDARADYSHLLLVLGRAEEAMIQIDSAVAFDPFDVKSQAFRAVVLLMGAGRAGEASEAFEAVLRSVPNHPVGWTGLFQAAAHEGRWEASVRAYTARARATGDLELDTLVTRVFAERGAEEAYLAAATLLEARTARSYVSATAVATAYALAGRASETLTWLERGIDEREANMPYIGVTPLYAFLHGEPRFTRLLERMRLPT